MRLGRLHSTIFAHDDQRKRVFIACALTVQFQRGILPRSALAHTCECSPQVNGEIGGMAEWFKATVLKTVVALWVTGGSNPSPSALKRLIDGCFIDQEGRCRSGRSEPPAKRL